MSERERLPWVERERDCERLLVVSLEQRQCQQGLPTNEGISCGRFARSRLADAVHREEGAASGAVRRGAFAGWTRPD